MGALGMATNVVTSVVLQGPFLGVGAEVYSTLDGAAQAIEDAEILGADFLELAHVLNHLSGSRAGIPTALVEEYQAAAREDNWAKAGEIQRRLAKSLRKMPEVFPWFNFETGLEGLRKMTPWVFKGGLFATRPRSSNARITIFSDPKLIPKGLSYRYARAVILPTELITCLYQSGCVDIRYLHPIHHLTEGITDLKVARKFSAMRKKLAKWKTQYPDTWAQYGNAILVDLTAGDKNSRRDRIRVGRLDRKNEFLILNGHRRLAALSLLALKGEVPVEWLRHIPVWSHQIYSPDSRARDRFAGGVKLDLMETFLEVQVGSVSPAEVFHKFSDMGLPLQESEMNPWELPEKPWRDFGRDLCAMVELGILDEETMVTHIVTQIINYPRQAFGAWPFLEEYVKPSRRWHRLIRRLTGDDPWKLAPFLKEMYQTKRKFVRKVVVQLLNSKKTTVENIEHFRTFVLRDPKLEEEIVRFLVSGDKRAEAILPRWLEDLPLQYFLNVLAEILRQGLYPTLMNDEEFRGGLGYRLRMASLKLSEKEKRKYL